jgi:hypothetical protein
MSGHTASSLPVAAPLLPGTSALSQSFRRRKAELIGCLSRRLFSGPKRKLLIQLHGLCHIISSGIHQARLVFTALVFA